MTAPVPTHRDHGAFVAALEQRCKVVIVSFDQDGRRSARVCIPLEHDVGRSEASEASYFFWVCDGRDTQGSQIVGLAEDQIISIRLTSDRYGSSDFAPIDASRRWRSGGEFT